MNKIPALYHCNALPAEQKKSTDKGQSGHKGSGEKGEEKGRSQKQAGEGRSRGRREFSELLLEPEKSFLPLKSSRCGLVPEREKEAERWRLINREGRGFINLLHT